MPAFLETDRLVLRQFTVADVDNLVELDSDPEVTWDMYRVPVVTDLQAALVFPLNPATGLILAQGPQTHDTTGQLGRSLVGFLNQRGDPLLFQRLDGALQQAICCHELHLRASLLL